MNRHAIAAAALLLLAPLSGCNTFMEGVTNGPIQVSRLGPDRWSLSSSRIDVDDGERRALYQAAITAKANGFGWFQILSWDDGTLGLGTGQQATVIGISDPAQPATCKAKSGYEWRCQPQQVDAVLARVSPGLHKTPEMIAADLAAAKQGLAPTP